MNPLLKFIVKRLEGKMGELHEFADEVENYKAYQTIVEDMESYFTELKQIVGDAIL